MRYSNSYFAFLLLSLSSIYAQAPAATRAILEGDVVNAATGAPIAGARVKIDPTQTDPLYGRSDAGGHFLFSSLPPAHYFLSVDAPGFLRPASTSVDLTLPRSSTAGTAGASCLLPNGTVARSADADGTLHARISVPLAAYAVITGTVTDPDGIPMEDSAVEILGKRPVQTPRRPSPASRPLPDGKNEIVTVAMVRTNDKGEFRAARLEPGTLYVVANKTTSRGAWESSFRATYYPHAMNFASAKPLELTAGQQVRADIQISRQSGVRVAGRLVKPEGEEYPSGPLLYTSVILVPQQSYIQNGNGPFVTGWDDYELNDVLPGKYTLMAVTRDASADPYGGNQKPVFGLTRPIEVGDRDMSGVDLVLQPLRDLAGAVTFREGCTPFAVRISLQSIGNPLAWGQTEAVSGADGRFVLHSLVMGKFTVSVSSSGRRVRAASIRLGDRDVEKDGFEAPLSGDDPLRIDIACDNSGGQR
jgi:hypothetical protein